MTERTVPADTQENPTGAAAGRGPTPQEAEAADRARPDVDLEQVEEHYEDMLEKGANVKGEGQIDPAR